MGYYTIKDIADELGITKQAVRYYIAKLPVNLIPNKTNGTYQVSAEARSFIKDSYNKSNRKDTRKVTGKEQGGFTGNKADELLVELLKNQNKTIEKLQTLLDQQQQLSAQDKLFQKEVKKQISLSVTGNTSEAFYPKDIISSLEKDKEELIDQAYTLESRIDKLERELKTQQQINADLSEKNEELEESYEELSNRNFFDRILNRQ